MKSKIFKNEEGISLVTTIVVVSLLTTLSIVVLSLVISDNKISANHVETAKAFWIAESGLEKGLYWLRYQDPPPAGTAPFTLFNNVSMGDGPYKVIVDPDDGNPSTYVKKYLIRSTGTITNFSRKLEVSIEMNTFNKFAYATGDEGPGTIWFTTGDKITGPLHSNDQIAIRGSPTFLGRVTSSASTFYKGSGYNPTFAEGFQLDAPTIHFPSGNEVLDNYVEVNGGPPVLTLDATGSKHAKVVFKSDGTINYSVWHKVGGTKIYDVPVTNVALDDINNFIEVKGDVQVKGTVSGQASLYATSNIKIIDDIKYLNSGANGQPDVDCPDHLGIISNRNIIVADNAANQNDVIITGALLALGNSFTVANYSSGSPRGYINLWGSLSQKIRGPVGTTGGTGYHKNYNYDERYLEEAPPYFPTTGSYEIASWREVVN